MKSLFWTSKWTPSHLHLILVISFSWIWNWTVGTDSKHDGHRTTTTSPFMWFSRSLLQRQWQKKKRLGNVIAKEFLTLSNPSNGWSNLKTGRHFKFDIFQRERDWGWEKREHVSRKLAVFCQPSLLLDFAQHLPSPTRYYLPQNVDSKSFCLDSA